MYSVFLKKGEEKRLRAGHSWVYANEVAHIDGKDKNGSLASVYSYDGKFVGKGYINHLSKILVRLFIYDENESDTDELFRARLQAAADYRKALGYDNSFRLVFAEADNLPALIVDKYADYLVCQFLSLGMDKQKEHIVKSLADLFSPKGRYERSDVAVRAKEGLEEKTDLLYGEVPDEIIIEENGVKMS
ncbi:MAG: rRNA large subunit methyltransferase I, partial [Clostridia bacterium]|nr:rRNA large subunit methyltransferase I [Clostridia bacterium]